VTYFASFGKRPWSRESSARCKRIDEAIAKDNYALKGTDALKQLEEASK
jgi:hypothetical protein